MKVLVALWGLLLVWCLISGVVENLVFFTDARYRGLWKDLEAFYLKTPNALSQGALLERYGQKAVDRFVTQPDFQLCYLPSEEAAFVNLLGYLGSEQQLKLEREGRAIPWPLVGLIILVCIYLPVIHGFRTLVRWITWPIAKKSGHLRLHYSYYETPKGKRRGSGLVSFAVVVLGSIGLAAMRYSEPMRAAGTTFPDLVTSFVVLSYLTGLCMRLVTVAIDGVLLSAGFHPHRMIWDELASLVLVAPLLRLVFQNSWLTILGGAVAGLGGGLLAKFLARKYPESTA